MEAVWPDSIVEENNLAQAISKLRQVFGETPGSHSYIVTVPGRGYRFVAEVRERTATPAMPESTSAVVQPLLAVGDTGWGEPFPQRQPKSPLISQSQHHLEVSRSSDAEGFWGCPRQLPGYGRLPSSDCYRLRRNLIFCPLSPFARECARGRFDCPERRSFIFAGADPRKERRRAAVSIISATKSKTPISPPACKMKSLRTLRESPTSR